MAFDYSKLNGRIREKMGTQEALARAMGISRSSLSLRLNNKIEFEPSEMLKICELLEIDKENDITPYFFTQKV